MKCEKCGNAIIATGDCENCKMPWHARPSMLSDGDTDLHCGQYCLLDGIEDVFVDRLVAEHNATLGVSNDALEKIAELGGLSHVLDVLDKVYRSSQLDNDGVLIDDVATILEAAGRIE